MNRPAQTPFESDLVARVLDSLAQRGEDSARGSASDGLHRLWESWNALSAAERDALAIRSAAEASAADAAAAPAATTPTRKRTSRGVKKTRTPASGKSRPSTSKKTSKSEPTSETTLLDETKKRKKKKRTSRKRRRTKRKRNPVRTRSGGSDSVGIPCGDRGPEKGRGHESRGLPGGAS